MVSSTQQSSRIRKRKQTTSGKRNKRERRAEGTPAFAVHPEGYDVKAADARPAAKPSLVAPKKAAKVKGEKKKAAPKAPKAK
jgi:hypothetical protein